MSQVGIVSNRQDLDLIPANIKSGIEIFGVVGNNRGFANIAGGKLVVEYITASEVVSDNLRVFQYNGFIHTLTLGASSGHGCTIKLSRIETTGLATDLNPSDLSFGDCDLGVEYAPYLDGNILHLNYVKYSTSALVHRDYNLTTLTLSSELAGHATIGIAQTNGQIISGSTFTLGYDTRRTPGLTIVLAVS